ncbi:MAG TPA: MlaD family protein [Fibrobacteria bacterium]|nr:MlaD family protein [Fibrobacteria bacterium]
MEHTSRIAGYTIAFLGLLGLMAVLAFLEEGSLFRRALVKVSFPTVGTLMVDDPVKLRGVEVGRVDAIEPGPDGPVVTLELYKKALLPRDTRFVNYNYSLFGARMVVLVPGHAAEPLDPAAVHAGHFSTGVTESIHKVNMLLRAMVEYQGLASRLEHGNDTTQSLEAMLRTKVYPTLDKFGAFATRLESLEGRASTELDGLARATGQVRSFSRTMAMGSDTLVAKAHLTVERLATLTTRTTMVLGGLEKMILSAQDTSSLAGRMLANRDLYERTLILAHALKDLLKQVEQEGLKNIIGFWRNVHIRERNP